MKFRPAFWPTLIAVPGIIALLVLGTWQVQRLYWKEGLIGERTARVAAEPVAAPPAGAAMAEDAVASLDYRRATATGVFMHARELYLAARTMNGNAGYQIVTPMTLGGGGTLLVNRGWVPVERKDANRRLEGQIVGTVTVEGILRRPGRQNWLVPDNEPMKNIWFWTDLPSMAAATGMGAPVVPMFLEAGPAGNPGGLPIGGQTRIHLPNDHLQYAIIWYALALALGAIYTIYTLRSPR